MGNQGSAFLPWVESRLGGFGRTLSCLEIGLESSPIAWDVYEMQSFKGS